MGLWNTGCQALRVVVHLTIESTYISRKYYPMQGAGTGAWMRGLWMAAKPGAETDWGLGVGSSQSVAGWHDLFSGEMGVYGRRSWVSPVRS